MNEHSQFFEKAKRYYDDGLWSKAKIKALTDAGKLTPEEYEEIVGEPYEE